MCSLLKISTFYGCVETPETHELFHKGQSYFNEEQSNINPVHAGYTTMKAQRKTSTGHIEVDVISHIDDTKYKGSIRDEFSVIAPAVVNILSDGNDKIQMHSLSNMALLTVDENAALNNSTFDVKRIKILDMDRNGDYIPICTKNVFMKYYSSSDTKLHFWSEEDRKSYIEAMNNVLYRHKEVNGNEIKLIKEEIHYGNK